MDKFKRKIIGYFLFCAFGISLLESMCDSTFDHILLPMYMDNEAVFKILLVIYLLLSIAIFVIFAFIFYHLTNKEVEKESRRQVNERNMIYSCITHDLKTPMTSVQGFSKALMEGRIKPEEQKEIFNIIYNKSCYMNELVESMFAYSKLNTEDYRLSFRKMDVCVLVRNLIALSYDEFEKREMDLQVEIPEEPIFCLLDEKEIKRGINNLIINAYKHNDNGTKILIRVYCHEKYIYIIVADSGKAISKEQEQNIFKPFECGNTARTSGSGNGLGLTISRIIMEKHGGKLYVRNDINGYTKGFAARLPQN